MAEPIVPPAAPVVPTYPQLGSSTFNQQAYAYGSSMPAVSQRQWEIGNVSYHNASLGYTYATTAQAAAVSATNAAQLVTAAANFKGRWEDLAGSLSMPATVMYQRQFWALSRDVSNVAAEVPGVSTAWVALPSSARVMQTVTSGVVVCAPWVTYKIAGTDVTLQFNTSAMIEGDLVGVRLIVPVSNRQYLDFMGKPFRGLAHTTPDYLDIPRFGADFYYDSIGGGWV